MTGPGFSEAGGELKQLQDVEVEKSMNIEQFVLILPLNCALRLLLCAEVDKARRRNPSSLLPGVFVLPSPSAIPSLQLAANSAIHPARIRPVPKNGNLVDLVWSGERQVRIPKTRLGIVARVAREGFCSGSLWYAKFAGARTVYGFYMSTPEAIDSNLSR